MSLYKQKSCTLCKTSTQIDLNRTRLKDFININIYINVYIPDLKKKKKSDLNQINSIFLIKKIMIFFNPGLLVL